MAKPEIAELAAEHDHILPRSLYFGIFGLLMVFTVITVAAAYVDLGNLNNDGQGFRFSPAGRS